VGPASERKNTLVPLIKKGTPLPTKGVESLKLREKLVGGTPGMFDVELFNQEEGVDEPELNLAIGVFRILADDFLAPGQVAEAGTAVDIHWEMDDNGLIRCSVVIPDLEAQLETGSYYVPQVSERRFDGEEGVALAQDKLGRALGAIEEARPAMAREPKLAELQRRLARQSELLANSDDAEARKSVMEEALHVQQELARLKNSEEHRRAVLLLEIETLDEGISNLAESMEPSIVERLQTLLRSAREEISNKNWDRVRQMIQQARAVFERSLFEQPAYILAMFERLSQERHSALDKDLFDRLVQQGWAAAEEEDLESVREVITAMFRNRMPGEGDSSGVAMLAGLMK